MSLSQLVKELVEVKVKLVLGDSASRMPDLLEPMKSRLAAYHNSKELQDRMRVLEAELEFQLAKTAPQAKQDASALHVEAKSPLQAHAGPVQELNGERTVNMRQCAIGPAAQAAAADAAGEQAKPVCIDVDAPEQAAGDARKRARSSAPSTGKSADGAVTFAYSTASALMKRRP